MVPAMGRRIAEERGKEQTMNKTMKKTADMTADMTTDVTADKPVDATEAPSVSAKVAPMMERVLAHLTDLSSPTAVFGAPIERGEMTLIPVSKYSVSLGVGGGGGTGPKQIDAPALGGEGVGGGGAKGRPIATIIVTPQRVEIQPIIDVTRVALAGMATAVAMTLFITATIRRA
jgi:uncharacterized spore protein YtfJ